jgi:hypothetical protein
MGHDERAVTLLRPRDPQVARRPHATESQEEDLAKKN